MLRNSLSLLGLPLALLYLHSAVDVQARHHQTQQNAGDIDFAAACQIYNGGEDRNARDDRAQDHALVCVLPGLAGFQALQAGDELHYRSRQGQSQSQIEQQCRRMAVRHCGQQCYAGNAQKACDTGQRTADNH